MRRALVVLALVAVAASRTGFADERRDVRSLQTQIMHVGALTCGFSMAKSGRAFTDIDDVGDEEYPLFGGTSEEPVFPLGEIDELVELIRGAASPAYWEETEGAHIGALERDKLLVRAHADAAKEVVAFLRTLERDLLTTITVDLQAVTVPADDIARMRGRALTDEQVQVLVESGGGPRLSTTAFVDQRASNFTGTQRLYVADYDVEVAQGAMISDPIVLVEQLGLSAMTMATTGARSGELVVEVDATLSGQDGTTFQETGVGRRIEVPKQWVHSARTTIVAKEGRWYLVDGQAQGGSAHHFFLIRATRTPHRPAGEPSPAEPQLSVKPSEGMYVSSSFHVGALTGPQSHADYTTRLISVDLRPSNFSPVPVREGPSNRPVVSLDTLSELLRYSIGDDIWDTDMAYMYGRAPRIWVYHAPEVVRAIGTRLDALRPDLLWTLSTEAQVIEVPDALAHRLPRTNGALLDAKALQYIERAIADGEATRTDAIRLTSLGPTNSVGVSGRDVAYVGDYEVEIAQDSVIAKPVVESTLSGMKLELRPHLSVGRRSVTLSVDLSRTRIPTPLPTFTTRVGTLHVPKQSVLRIRSSVHVPLGGTILLGAGSSGEGKQLLVLLTPQMAEMP